MATYYILRYTHIYVNSIKLPFTVPDPVFNISVNPINAIAISWTLPSAQDTQATALQYIVTYQHMSIR